MAKWTEFQPGVFSREGDVHRVGRHTYLFKDGEWTPKSAGAKGKPLPAELRSRSTEGDRYSQRPPGGHQTPDSIF